MASEQQDRTCRWFWLVLTRLEAPLSMSNLTDGCVFCSNPSIFYHFSLNGGLGPLPAALRLERGSAWTCGCSNFNRIHKCLADVDQKIAACQEIE